MGKSSTERKQDTIAEHRFTRVEFHRFKAFEEFTLRIQHFNILVGPNNSGKSTILTAFRILAAAMRKASNKNPAPVQVDGARTFGYAVELDRISVGGENIFHNYDDSKPASVAFHISNGNVLTLHFPEQGVCHMVAKTAGDIVNSASAFRASFKCGIGFVPILGPVEHEEKLFDKEAARLALFNYRAARNFRNIWHHYPERFEVFREQLRQTWPGMDVEQPKVTPGPKGAMLHMFCPEDRIPREIFWAGFGFQVWCQMLTHLVHAEGNAIFLIDEPDIYLHSDLQRQLVSILRSLGPDIMIATHSTEIITDAEPDDIVLVSKGRKSARRINEPTELVEVFSALGSNLNPTLTQLAKTRAAVFVEGQDFQIISRFARRLEVDTVRRRADFAVVPVGGFSPERIRSLKDGMEATLGGKIKAAVVLDRDFRSGAECQAIRESCEAFADLVVVHDCKEIENFLLVPSAIDLAAAKRRRDQNNRTGGSVEYIDCAKEILDGFAVGKKSYVTAQHLSTRRRFERIRSPGMDDATVTQAALEELDKVWDEQTLSLVPGKDAMAALNTELRKRYSISVTATGVIDAMSIASIPGAMKELVAKLAQFASKKTRAPN